jgi:hypothetical protein
VYLDAMHVRSTLFPSATVPDILQPAVIEILPWPNGAKAAVAFTFDWESAMGGMIHTRSNKDDDPNFRENWRLRAIRMRNGVTTTLDLFRPYGIRATYYATGYNFLLGNTEKRLFMDNPSYTWANADNGWDNRWKTTPWFADDPHGTVQSDLIWYFGDLVPKLQAEKQDIQSHTFAHIAGTYIRAIDWNKDFGVWHQDATAGGVSAARSLAFPWSASNGMSDDDWNTLAANEITSVTRTAWSQRKSALFAKDARGIVHEPQCKPVPGHETILACPDFYLRDGSAMLARQQIDRVIAAGGMIDLWAHIEEVTTLDQIANWRIILEYAAQKRDLRELWIAPLSEIAAWQQAQSALSIQMLYVQRSDTSRAIRFAIVNNSIVDMQQLTVKMPVTIQRATVDGIALPLVRDELFTLNLAAGQRAEVIA